MNASKKQILFEEKELKKHSKFSKLQNYKTTELQYYKITK